MTSRLLLSILLLSATAQAQPAFDVATLRPSGAPGPENISVTPRSPRPRREKRGFCLLPDVARNGPRLHEPTAKDATRFVESQGEGLPRFGREKMLMVADHFSMADLAEQLSEPLQRPVIDRTGLTSRYDIRLDPAAYMTPPEGDGPQERIDPISMILTAIPQPLGLKVETGKDAVPFWIVDAANRAPSGN